MRRTFTVVLAGVAAAACVASASQSNRPMTVTLYPPDIPELVAIRLDVSVDGARVGTMDARKADVREEPTVRFALPPGFHRYAFGGHADLTGGRRVALEGSGVLVAREYLTAQLESRAAQGDPLAALEVLIAAHRAAAGPEETLPRLERSPTRPSAKDIAAAETRLGLRLPPTYVTLLQQYGPFAFVEPGDEGGESVASALYAPSAVYPVPEWRQRVRKAPLDAGDTPRARQRLSLLARDVVVATTLDTGWTVRAGSHPACPDGHASLSGEFIFETESGEDLWNDDTDHHASYFGDREAKCGDRVERIRDNITASFITGFGKRAGLPQDGALRPQPADSDARPARIRLSFGEYR